MTEYSQELIDECIKCFKDENGVELTQEEAVEVLKNLGGLFLAFAGHDSHSSLNREL
jgi:hypothetical protein